MKVPRRVNAGMGPQVWRVLPRKSSERVPAGPGRGRVGRPGRADSERGRGRRSLWCAAVAEAARHLLWAGLAQLARGAAAGGRAERARRGAGLLDGRQTQLEARWGFWCLGRCMQRAAAPACFTWQRSWPAPPRCLPASASRAEEIESPSSSRAERRPPIMKRVKGWRGSGMEPYPERMEVVWEILHRVGAGIDVHKASLTVCVRRGWQIG